MNMKLKKIAIIDFSGTQSNPLESILSGENYSVTRPAPVRNRPAPERW